MFTFFDQIIGFFSTIFSVIVNAINSMLVMIEVLLSLMGLSSDLLLYLPAVIMSSVTITLALGTVKFLLGR